MKKKKILLSLVLSISLLLTGCGWMDGRYVSVTRHREPQQGTQQEAVMASNHMDLIKALVNFVEEGAQSGVIILSDYPLESAKSGMEAAIRYAMETDPIGAYAVQEIHYEEGTNNGLPAVAVSITYRRSAMEIQRVQELEGMEEASAAVREALLSFESNVVMMIRKYAQIDFVQLVHDYAEAYPQFVMEIPQVTVGVFGGGSVKVVELSFAYQTSRDSLRQMQSQVAPVFEAASLYVSGNGTQRQKFTQLYSFLMERSDYKFETSITPAYSLLHHGVGDSRAFAVAYGAMCRSAGLECMTVTGTHAGEPRTWNIVRDNNHYYHLDLLRCHEEGRFRVYTDVEMDDYVWDYSAYPKCPAVYNQTEKQIAEVTVPVQPTEPEAEQPTLPETVPAEAETVPE